MPMPGIDIRRRGAPLDCESGDEQSRVVVSMSLDGFTAGPHVREEEQS